MEFGQVVGTGFEFRVIGEKRPGVYVALGLSRPFEGEQIIVNFEKLQESDDGRIILHSI